MTAALLAVALLSPQGFEEAHTFRAMAKLRMTPEAAPDGKRVAFVEVVRYEVLVEHEPFPTFFNWFHWVTTEKTIRRELLFEVGDTFDPEVVAESARNLRAMVIFALVKIVPVKGRKPGEVGLLVVTRDLWSLRLESQLQRTDSHIDLVELRMTERNLLGRNKLAAVRWGLGPTTWSPGLRYADRRVFGEPMSLNLGSDAFFRRTDSKYDGLQLTGLLQQPFFDLKQREGWSLNTLYQRLVVRRTQAGDVVTNADGVPLVWDHEALSADALWRRQYGGRYVVRLSAGLGLSRVEREANEETGLDGFDEGDGSRFREADLPPSRVEVGPIIGAALFRGRFRTYRDLAAYGISEDVRLGPSLGVSARVPRVLLGSTADAAVLGGSATWAEDWAGNGLAELAVAGELRVQDAERFDEHYLVRARGATPPVVWGRLVTRVDWLRQRHDTVSNLVSLGGDNGLRGYQTQRFLGRNADRLRGNVEWRSKPVALSFLHLGGLLFYDFGAVYEGDRPRRLFQSVGVGLRAMLPQFNRFVVRFDLGYAIDERRLGSGLQSGQMVPTTVREDVLYEHAVGGLFNQP